MENVLLHKVEVGDQPMDVDFHPTQPFLATGVVDGKLLIHSCARDAATLRHSLKAHGHDHPCRAVRFSLGGDLILTASTDKSILAVDVATGKARARKRDAHPSAITRLAGLSETLAASGDEDGCVSIWDSRQADAVAALSPHTEYVSDMRLHAPQHALLTVSGDGTLALIDLRTQKLRDTSEGDADDELLSVAVMKGGRKVVCGTTSGVLNVWSWGCWADCSDRFPGHPDSVTSLIKYDEDTVLTASSDGIIRVLNIQPNKMLGVLGEHGEFDVEQMAASAREFQLLASASHDNTVKVWDLGVLADDEDGEAEEEEQEETVAQAAVEEGKKDGGGGSSGSDSGEVSDGEGGGKRRKRRKNKTKGEHKIKSKKHHQGNNFFSGLL